MDLDIRTLAIFMSLTNILQVTALYAQYRINKVHHGLGWWTLGTALWAAGFVLNSMRSGTPLGLAAIILNNFCFVAGLAAILVGVLRFFSRRVRPGLLIFSIAGWALLIVWFTLARDDLAARTILTYGASAILVVLTALALYAYRPRAITASAHFLASVFLGMGLFFTYRAVAPFFTALGGDLFAPTVVQVVS